MTLNRRQFLTHSCQLGVALPTVASGLLSLGSMREAAAAVSSDYKALVCILLAGGNDSYNMLVPTDSDQYAGYQRIRADLALPREQLLPVALANTDSRQFGLHPGMTALQRLINDGDAAMIANIGTLVEPYDAIAVNEGRQRLPVGLFSHADQIQQWQTAVVDNRTAIGWAGRLADQMQNTRPSNGVSMNISLSGTNVFQSGRTVAPYSIRNNGSGAVAINEYDSQEPFGLNRRRAFESIFRDTRSNLLAEEYRSRMRGAIDQQIVFAEAMANASDLSDSINTANPLSLALAQIARVISVSDALGATRQTFFVTVGGWDHHDEVLANQARMLPTVAEGLADFAAVLKQMNAFNAVTTFTISDFGRTMTSNGRGSDHGWGGHHVVMGGDVAGSRLLGAFPLLDGPSPLDVGRGVYIPTTGIDSYFADLALWYGVPPAELDIILPNIGRFYDPSSGVSPLGLFA
ncbi:MAG: DUF1501 domain-containing protein [Pseudomonadota bacterium]